MSVKPSRSITVLPLVLSTFLLAVCLCVFATALFDEFLQFRLQVVTFLASRLNHMILGFSRLCELPDVSSSGTKIPNELTKTLIKRYHC